MTSSPPDISVVVPVYGCEKVLFALQERLREVMLSLQVSFETIYVHDGASERSWEIIEELVKTTPSVVGVRLSRNYGQHYAITAGIDCCKGNWLIVMDCDLQDRPEEITKFWVLANKGFDIVVGRRRIRQDSYLKRLSSRLFHKMFRYMTEQESDAAQANFGIYSRKVIEHLKSLPEYSRCFPLLVRWLGFTSTTIDVEHDARLEGKTTYNLGRLMTLAIDAIVSYSNKPLKLFINIGFTISFVSTCFATALFFRYFMYDQPVQGWTSVMVSLFFLSGVNLLGLGTLGLYIGRIFNQVKGRPLYVIDEIVRKKPDTSSQQKPQLHRCKNDTKKD